MVDIAFHPAALREYQAAVDWYQQRSRAAARRFVAQMERVLGQIAQQPDRFGWHDGEFREAALKRFPYSVVYRVEDSGDVLVIAVAHAAREPDFWQDRA
jgi:plasmid stabilization system protein ParE